MFSKIIYSSHEAVCMLLASFLELISLLAHLPMASIHFFPFILEALFSTSVISCFFLIQETVYF